jgi:hypothetical protein
MASGRSVSLEKFMSPGIHSLESREFAEMYIFANLLDSVKWAKHA